MSDHDPKAALREALLARRRSQDADEVARRSAALSGQLLVDAAWRAATCIAAFVGVRGEPDTWALLDEAWARGKHVWLPSVRPAGLVFVHTRSRAQIVPACFGLLEPVADDEAPRALADVGASLVLVPGLAFGRDGARIGFGRGYYDRALAPLRDHALPRRVGLCFAPFLDPAAGPIPMAAHDVPMHAVATDARIVEV